MREAAAHWWSITNPTIARIPPQLTVVLPHDAHHANKKQQRSIAYPMDIGMRIQWDSIVLPAGCFPRQRMTTIQRHCHCSSPPPRHNSPHKQIDPRAPPPSSFSIDLSRVVPFVPVVSICTPCYPPTKTTPPCREYQHSKIPHQDTPNLDPWDKASNMFEPCANGNRRKRRWIVSGWRGPRRRSWC